MQTFTDMERDKLRTTFDALVMNVGPAPELEDLVDRPVHLQLAAAPRQTWLVVAIAAIGLLVGIGLTALLVSDEPPLAADPGGRGDVIVFFPSNTPFDTVLGIADEMATWEGVAIASPWTSQDAFEEFTELFADQPDLIALVREDPSILPSSVRIWVEPGVDVSAIAARAEDEYPGALDVGFDGEAQPDASDFPDSTLPPLEILLTQVDPIYGYGDYSGYTYAEVPWDRVTAALMACMQDQGWPVIPDGDTGILFRDVPLEDNEASQIGLARCQAGLNLPEYAGPPNG